MSFHRIVMISNILHPVLTTQFNNEWNTNAGLSLLCSFLCVLDVRLWVFFFFISFSFSICLSYLLLLRIPFGLLLLSIARQLIRMDHILGCPRCISSCRDFRHTSGTNFTSLSDHSFSYLTEKLHLEHRGHNKGGRLGEEHNERQGGSERTNKAKNQ